MSATSLNGRPGRTDEVWRVFLKLGLTSFGGPVAHLAYFREEFVVRRRWLDDASYGELVALAQFIPGPASSQVGMVLGFMRAGWVGAFVAWLAFTLPSAVLMYAAAVGLVQLGGAAAAGALGGLKLFAVGVVAMAVWGMSRSLTPDVVRIGIALLAAVVLLLTQGASIQVGVIAAAAVLGVVLLRLPAAPLPVRAPVSPGVGAGVVASLIFGSLLIGLPLIAGAWALPGLQLFDSFYRAGALVFGGGHVVLPLLHAELVPTGWLDDDVFIAGYAIAQALPGPLFTFATYAGAAAQPASSIAGAVLATLAIFLPAFLLIFAALPFWQNALQRPLARRAVAGASAGVVGALLAALINPVGTNALHTPFDALAALLILALLASRRVPVWAIAAASALLGGALAAVSV